jgi:hypothetical protein
MSDIVGPATLTSVPSLRFFFGAGELTGARAVSRARPTSMSSTARGFLRRVRSGDSGAPGLLQNSHESSY